MSWVVYVLKKAVPGMTVKRATKIMLTAHTEGRAVVKSCHRELAELYEERLRAKGPYGEYRAFGLTRQAKGRPVLTAGNRLLLRERVVAFPAWSPPASGSINLRAVVYGLSSSK